MGQLAPGTPNVIKGKFFEVGEKRETDQLKTQISTIKNQFIAETAESQDSVLTGSV